MIPQSIRDEHVFQAIGEIRAGRSKKREPTKFNLVYEGRQSVAAIQALAAQ